MFVSRNFYGIGERDTTQYLQKVEDNLIHEIVDRLERSFRLPETRASAIRKFNAGSRVLKRGIALTPVKFGISFTATHLNQAGALLHVYTDGTVQLNHGGTEMGQGLFIKVAQVVADELQIDIGRIKLMASDTSKVPNASATAASSGSDLNGKAAQAAARKIKRRMTRFAAEYFSVAEDEIEFINNEVRIGSKHIAFAELARLAWFARNSLSATGFYKTPKITYDRSTFSGRPFFYFAFGAAVSEVIVDTLTGEHRLLRVDILHDCGQVTEPGHRPRANRGRIRPGRGLADQRRAVVERKRRASHACTVDVQDPDLFGRAAGISRDPAGIDSQSREDDLSLEGGWRATADARTVRFPCLARRHPQRR